MKPGGSPYPPRVIFHHCVDEVVGQSVGKRVARHPAVFEQSEKPANSRKPPASLSARRKIVDHKILGLARCWAEFESRKFESAGGPPQPIKPVVRRAQQRAILVFCEGVDPA